MELSGKIRPQFVRQNGTRIYQAKCDLNLSGKMEPGFVWQTGTSNCQSKCDIDVSVNIGQKGSDLSHVYKKHVVYINYIV